MKPDLSIIMPSTGRPEQLKKCIERFRETLPGVSVEFCIAIDKDRESYNLVLGMPDVVATFSEEYVGVQQVFNRAYDSSSADLILMAQDDLWPSDDWFGPSHRSMFAFSDFSCVVGLNDLIRPHGQPFTTCFLLARSYINEFQGGYLCCPHYWSAYVDNEIQEVATKHGRYVYAEDAILEHRNWTNGKAEHDATYHLTDGWYERDTPTYEKRKAAGFPMDYAKVKA